MKLHKTTSTHGGKVTIINGASVDSLFAKHGTRFKCCMCGACCSFQVELSPKDVKRLGRVDPQVERRLERRDHSPPTIQHRGDTEYNLTKCVYLDNACRCSVYDARPYICMLYPFFPIPASDIDNLGVKIPNDAVSLNMMGTGSKFYVTLDPLCPGYGHGSKIDWQKFNEIFERYCLKD
jgi:Fe-S-cluster containining protein